MTDSQVAPFWAFTTTKGVPMVARMIKKTGMREPCIEFYDLRYPFTTILTHKEGALQGQFISRYYVSTIMEREPHRGLCLDGGIPNWDIDADNMDRIIDWMDLYVMRRVDLYGGAA